MKRKILSASLLSLLFISPSLFATDIQWSGRYRVEGHDLRGYDLDGGEKSFALHHLYVTPKITVKDDVIINTRLDIFNNSRYGAMTNQIGSFLGSPTNVDSTTATFDDSEKIGESLNMQSVAVTQMYLSWLHENGALLVGRAPKHFGLGISHNAGTGEFDHWMDTHDVIAYKIIAGNHSFTPMYAKKQEGQIIANEDVHTTTFEYQYRNPDTDLTIGVYWERTSSPDKIDSTSSVFGGTPTSGYRPELRSFYLHQRYDSFLWELEAGFMSGDTGVVASSESVDFDSYGFLNNLKFNLSSEFQLDARFGLASGDKSSTADFEGFFFDRNVNIASILFNHRLGSDSLDTLGTSVGGSTSDGVDNEYLSNTIFLSPKLTWKVSDKWAYDFTLTYAQLHEELVSGGSKQLGTEFDFGASYRPNDATLVRLEGGYLVSGSAFEGSTSLSSNNAFIITAKAAISF